MLKMQRRAPAAAQRGLSIVELMVGVAVGLFVAAAAAMLVSTQLSSNRRLLLDTQLQQDLRATADIITRELRRSGALLDGPAADVLWSPGRVPLRNLLALSLSPTNGSSTEVTYQYQRLAGTPVRYGYRLSGSKIESRNGRTWQDLTDDAVMKVTAFDVTASVVATGTVPCPNDCPGGGQACWPTYTVRDIAFRITAEAKNDPSIVRSIQSTVRVRNDVIRGDAGVTSGMCP